MPRLPEPNLQPPTASDEDAVGGDAAGLNSLLAFTWIWVRLLGRDDRPAIVVAWLMLVHVPIDLVLLPSFPPCSWVPPVGTALLVPFLDLAAGTAHLLSARPRP